MSASRRAAEQSASRRVNRQHNASPYGKKRLPTSTSTPQAEAGEIKTSSGLGSIFSMIWSPFRRKASPPKSLPQIRQSRVGTDDDDGDEQQEVYEEEPDEGTSVDDTMMVQDALNEPMSAASSLSSRNQINQVPFPLVSPQKPYGEPPRRQGARPANSANRLGPSSSASPLTLSQLGGPSRAGPSEHNGSPLKPIQDFLDSKAKSGAGLTNEELRRLNTMMSSPSFTIDEDNLPSAAFLDRGLKPAPSQSFLAPQPLRSSTIVDGGFAFTAGSNPNTTFAQPPSQIPRRRLRYLGPGQGSNTRPPRPAMVMKTGDLHRKLNPPTANGIAKPNDEPEQPGKRRRVDGPPNSHTFNGFKSPEPSNPEPSADIPSDSQREGGSTFNSRLSTRATSPALSSGSKPTQLPHFKRPLPRHIANPTPAPVIPSPLRQSTKAEPSPPPRRSQTSSTLMDMIKTADEELAASGATPDRMEIEQAVANPFEKSGIKTAVPVAKKKPIPMRKPIFPPKAVEQKKPEIASSAQAIVASLPSPPKEKTPVESKSRIPAHSKSSSKPAASPFLPPPKPVSLAKPNGNSNGPYTIDDVDDDDDVMEIQEIPVPSTSSSSKPSLNGFAVPKRPTPPPIVVEEMEEDDNASAQAIVSRPSLVIEPGEPRGRIGRSPSLGPHTNLYSPTIPSPLRLVSMPTEEEDELANDSSPAPQLGPSPLKLTATEVADPESQAKSAPSSSLPTYKFDVSVKPFVRAEGTPATEAVDASLNKLPKFDVTVDLVIAPVQPFNWEAAGFKPKPVAAGTWTCEVCAVPNAPEAVECVACTTAKPGLKASQTNGSTSIAQPLLVVAATGFNWAAAGMKPKQLEADEWRCSVCDTVNKASAAKCIACAADAPSSTVSLSSTAIAPPTPPVTGFNFAAAGFAMQPKAADTWTCSLCSCVSPSSAPKCTVCGADRS